MRHGDHPQPHHLTKGTVTTMSGVLNAPTRLYMVVNTTDSDLDDSDLDEFAEYREGVGSIDGPNPEGWDDYSLERWGEVRPFFFPSTKRVYLSRSAAQERAGLIRRWGGTAEVVECTPQWQTIDHANRERQKRVIHARITKLEDALAAERANYKEVASE